MDLVRLGFLLNLAGINPITGERAPETRGAELSAILSRIMAWELIRLTSDPGKAPK